VSMVRVGNRCRRTVIVRRIRVDRWNKRHIWWLGYNQIRIAGMSREALVVGAELQGGRGGEAKTNVDSLNPFGSLMSGKCSPLPTHARVGTNRLCDDRRDCRAKE